MELQKNISELLSKEILNELKCAYCNLYLSLAPVRCITNGKAVCGRCPIRRSEPLGSRYVIYEKSVSDRRFPCIYDHYGCEEKLLFDHVRDHEEKCPYAPIMCLASTECTWKGLSKNIFEHLVTHNMDMKNNQFEIDTDVDKENFNAALKVNNLSILLQFQYLSDTKVLYVNALSFNTVSYECQYKLNFFNAANRENFVGLSSFKCNPYVSRYFNIKMAEKIDLKKYLPALGNPKNIIVEVLCTYEIASDKPAPGIDVCSSQEILAKITCSKCSFYMIPPIIRHKNSYCCLTCKGKGSIDETMNNFAKTVNYPCRWNMCFFVGRHNNIRQHEFKCEFALMKCTLGCNRSFNLQGFKEHLQSAHSETKFLNTISIDLSADKKHSYSFLYDDELVVLQISIQNGKLLNSYQDYFSSYESSFSTIRNEIQNRQQLYRVSITCLNLFVKGNTYKITYYLTHSHCKLMTKSYTTVFKNSTVIDESVLKRPDCFNTFRDGYTLVIDSVKKE